MRKINIYIIVISLIICSLNVNTTGNVQHVSFKSSEEISTSAYGSHGSAYDYYMLVPSKVRAAFETSGWTWYVYKAGSLSSRYGYSQSIMGITRWNDHVIVIDRRDVSQSAIIHELGHWMNHYYNNGIDWMDLEYAFEAEWTDVYNIFGGSVSNYDTVEEYGAEAFSCYVLYPETMNKVAPITYEVINDFVNNTHSNDANRITVLGEDQYMETVIRY